MIAGLCGLFAAGDAPVERLRDLDTYYATTPYMREMICLYLTAHTVAALVMTSLCRRWSRSVHGLLRTSLLLICVGYLLSLCYDGLKYAAIGARWARSDWDVLSTDIARTIASLSSLLVGAGFMLPLAGRRITTVCRPRASCLALGPLRRVLTAVVPQDAVWLSPFPRVGRTAADATGVRHP
ncbi:MULTISPECIES: hypothetical protein [unclassified Streptomyces]|uniref:hypothetical protein n=1 Tax=Streptomyces TaxID=1883 RepID=UPI001369D9E2|nr:MULTISPECIES: hypothetical protein [unclassified Streptomyces]MYZ12125.1 hypothetical protein [Streptomyces sp. SID337]NDZ84149.1 hypothetical protein [Streptomyces sp. SID10115]NEA01318.1 hypothetical protein [Streptomyces sp. SID10116]NEB44642.1 hypothetical protein [Streptomyces sp. SID339]